MFKRKKYIYFYYATIAYYVGLNAVLGWPLATANDLEKKDISC